MAHAPDVSFRRRTWFRRLAWTVSAIALLVVASWLAVPPLARWQIESRLTEALGRATRVDAVAFNPLRLRLTVHKLVVAARTQAAPLFACDEIVADLSTASLWHRAPVLDELRLVRPAVALARDRDGRYDIDDVIERVRSQPSGPPARFSLNNIEVDDGSVAFDDGVAGRRHLLAALDVGIPFLSSLPYETDIRVTPRLKGTLNGSSFALGGTAAPFAQRVDATLDIDLDGLPLAQYVAYLPEKPRFDVAGGALTTRLKVAFVDGKPGERRLELRGDARIDRLAIKRRDGSPLVAAERIAVALDRVDLFGRDAAVASIAVDAPAVELKRLPDGSLELAGPLFERATSPVPASHAAPAADERAWSASIGKLALSRGTLALIDDTAQFRSDLADVALDVTKFSTRAGQQAHVDLAFVSADRIASFKAAADVEPTIPSAKGHFELAKFSLGLLFPYYRSAFAVDVQKGSLDLASSFALESDGKLRLTDGVASIADLRLALPGKRDPLWRVPALAAGGIDVDVASRKVTIGSVQSRGAALRLVREHDGSFEMARLLRPAAPGASSSADASWSVVAKKTVVERIAIDVEDRGPEPAMKLAIRDFDVTASDLSNLHGAKSTLALRARVGERGRIAFTGTLDRDPLALAGRIEGRDLALVPFKTYVEPNINVVLTGGTLAMKGRVALDVPDGGDARAAWQGDIAITDFATLDKPTTSDLARWRSLTLEGLDVATSPPRVAVTRIGVDDFYARVIVYPDGTLNLARLLTPGAEPQPPVDAKPATTVEPAVRQDSLPVTIGRIELTRGNVNFTDLFVRPNYSANLTDVVGSVTTMSGEQAGDLAIAARLEHTAPVEVQGHIHPFAKELSLDIAAKARDVDLPPLTPYSVKYAGYGIEKGKLTFDVHYQLDNRKLAAENRIVLDQLTFGEHVDSPTATKLPVLLAVALLKDSRGVIDVRLPISGSLDDPQFSVGHLIIQVIVNLITKAATAPFALLSAAFGGGEELSVLVFAPGSASIADDAQKRIDTLGKALADRPGLKLDIGGRADPASDREALRRAAVEMAMKREKMKSLARTGSAPASVDQVTIAPDERDRWLTAAYRESSLPDRPRNVIGMLKDVPPAEMDAMLYKSITIDDEALRLLANSRASAVKEAIAARGVDRERIFLVAPRIGSEAATAKPSAPVPASISRVDLALH